MGERMPGDCPDLITGSAPRLHPEGVTYAPDEKRFLVGSVTHGTVSAVRPDGSVRTLVDDPALIMTMGLAVDAARGAVYRVPVDGAPGSHLRDDRLMPAGGRHGANGIVLHPKGFLLIAHTSRRALFKLAGGELTEVTVDQPIGAADGLLLDAAGALHVVDNHPATNRVLTLASTDVLSGRLDLPVPGSDQFFLRRLPAPDDPATGGSTAPPS